MDMKNTKILSSICFKKIKYFLKHFKKNILNYIYDTWIKFIIMIVIIIIIIIIIVYWNA